MTQRKAVRILGVAADSDRRARRLLVIAGVDGTPRDVLAHVRRQVRLADVELQRRGDVVDMDGRPATLWEALLPRLPPMNDEEISLAMKQIEPGDEVFIEDRFRHLTRGKVIKVGGQRRTLVVQRVGRDCCACDAAIYRVDRIEWLEKI